GVLSALNVLGAAPPPNPLANDRGRPQPWVFIRELKNSCRVQSIEVDAIEIPDDLDLLLVIHPKKLKPRTQYAIDQYVLKGGKALVFFDPFCEADQASQVATDVQSRLQTDFLSEMPALFKAWGIQLWRGQLGAADPDAESRSVIVADQDLACPIGDPRTGPTEKMYVWLRLGSENCNRDEIITGRLEDLIVATAAGIAKTSSGDKIAFTPLLTSSDKASTIEDFMVRFGLDPEQIRKGYKPGATSVALAAKITGEFKTAFPDGRPAADSSEEGAPPGIDPDPDQLKASRQPTTIVVVGDVDMISDRFSVSVEPFFNQQIIRRINDNLVFAANAVENLTGSQELIGLRSRGRSRRPFTRVLEIERRAAEKWGDEKKRLDEKLKEANDRLLELQRGGGDKRVLEQATVQEVEKLRSEQLETKRNLRLVRLHLREDTERLGLIIKAINIALIPSFVVLVSIAIAVLKTLRRKQAAA
ncbi:MAG TPA: Gldg family protein, partial [Sumerlaeia bacterium]|nr:Gldg family protein [Sumerlaeia bacterium]